LLKEGVISTAKKGGTRRGFNFAKETVRWNN
jgi:hypothetical protein